MTPNDSTPGDAPRPALVGRRILLVDGDEQSLQKSVDLLAPHGCILGLARSAAEAREILETRQATEPYDAMVAAMELPDDLGTLFLIQLSKTTKPLPTVLYKEFGYDHEFSTFHAQKHGVVQVIMKFSRDAQLLDAVEKVLAQGALP